MSSENYLERMRRMRELNEKKEYRPCLGCGKEIYTDRCHRICKICSDKNRKPLHGYVPKTIKISSDAKRIFLGKSVDDFADFG